LHRNFITDKNMNTIKLTDIAEITSGTYQKEVTDGDLLYLQVKDLKSSYLADGELKPSIIDSGKIAKYTLIDKDLLFAAKGTSNFCALYRETMGKAVASSAFFVIRVSRTVVLPEYLCWYINTPQVLKKLQFNAVGSATPSITKEMLAELEINVPIIDIQRKIIQCNQLQEKEYALRMQITEKARQLSNQLLLNATK
jgi:restriction endonuclease S subunit